MVCRNEFDTYWKHSQGHGRIYLCWKSKFLCFHHAFIPSYLFSPCLSVFSSKYKAEPFCDIMIWKLIPVVFLIVILLFSFRYIVLGNYPFGRLIFTYCSLFNEKERGDGGVEELLMNFFCGKTVSSANYYSKQLARCYRTIVKQDR